MAGKKVQVPDGPPTVIRGHELPVNAAVLPDGEDGRPLLQACWRHTRFLANWLMGECRAADVRPTPDMTSLPKPEDPRLYERFTGLTRPGGGRTGERVRSGDGYPDRAFFEGATQTVNAVITRVKAEYLGPKNARRTKVLLQGIGRFPEYTLGEMPWYVDADQWYPLTADDGGLLVRCRLPGPGRGEKAMTTLHLRGGAGREQQEFARQVAHFRSLLGLPAGNRAELSIFARRIGSNSPHRPAIWMHGEPFRIMCRFTARVPVSERPGDRTLVLLTDPNAFWVAELDGRRAWILNADHVTRLVLHDEHLRRLQRIGEDGKAERRMGSNRHQKVQRRLERLCDKDRNRLASWTHESAAHLAGFCVRQRVGNVLYLDRDQGFCPRFPWHELRGKLAQKLQAAGVGLYTESGLEAPSPQDGKGEECQARGGSLGGYPPHSPPGFMIDLRPGGDDERWVRITRLREMAARKVMAARSRSGSHPAVSAP